MIIFLQITQLLFSILIFFGFAISISLLLFPKLIIKIAREKGLLYTFFIVIAVGFTGNAILGYILDLLRALYWYYHFGITILLILIILWKKRYELNILLDRLINLVRRVFSKKNWNRSNIIKITILCSIFIIIFFNLFFYPLLHYSIPLTDPYYTMYIVRFILNNHYLYDTAGGYHFYPYGIFYNIFFFSSYSPINLFWIMKFFGPLILSLSILFMSLIIYNITNNFLATVGSLLVWLSAPIISTFGVLTVSSSFGIFLGISSFSIFVFHLSETRNNYINKNSIIICSGFLLGGGFLYHSIVGGFYPLFGYIFYFIYEIIKKRRIFNPLKFIIALVLTMLPYIILFRLPDILINDLFELGNTNGNLIMIIPKTFLLSVPLINFKLDINFGINLIDIWGPSAIFFIISIFSIIRVRYHFKQIIFFLGLILISLFWIFNPIVINSIPIRDVLDKNIYETLRGNYYLVIAISFFTGIALKSINSVFKKVSNIRWKWEREFKLVKKLIPTALIMTVLINQFYISYSKTLSSKTIYGSNWPNPIDDGYSECLNWLNINASPNSSVIIPNTDYWHFFDPARIYKYQMGMAYDINFEENTYFYQYLDHKEANSTFSKLWQNTLTGEDITHYSSNQGWFDLNSELTLNEKHFIPEWQNRTNVLYLEKFNGTGYIVYNSFISGLELNCYFPNKTLGSVDIVFIDPKLQSNGFRFDIQSNQVILSVRSNETFNLTGISIPTNEWIHFKIISLPNLAIFMNSIKIWEDSTNISQISKVLIGLSYYSFYINDIMIPPELIFEIRDAVINELITFDFIIFLNKFKEYIDYFYQLKMLLEIFTSIKKDFSILKIIQ